MIQHALLKQVSKQLRLVALFFYALSVCLPMAAGEAVASDNYAHQAPLDQLKWDTNTVDTHKKTLPIYLRNRKIKHYALIAVVASGVLGCVWYINQPVEKALPEITPAMEFNQESFNKLCEVVARTQPKNIEPYFSLSVGRWKILSCPKPDAIIQAVKSLVPCSIAAFAVQKATGIFNFREDMAWFYHEEKHIAMIGKYLEAQALNLDAAVATKQSDATILLKKAILLEDAHHYLDCLMSLYVFMEYRSAQILAKFDPQIRQNAQPRFNNFATSVMQSGIELCDKLNHIIAKTAHDATQPTETARTLVMQTHNLMQALVASFVRLEDSYNK